MKVEFQYKRQVGTIEYLQSGRIRVTIDNQPELQEQIHYFFSLPISMNVQFSHPGIPGMMQIVRKMNDEEGFKLALTKIEKCIAIWIHHSTEEENGWSNKEKRELTEIPWFGKTGVTLVKWNGDDATPWWVIEDLATGFQAFYEPNAHKYSALEWFRKSIVDSGLVEHWQDYVEEFKSLKDISYTENWAK